MLIFTHLAPTIQLLGYPSANMPSVKPLTRFKILCDALPNELKLLILHYCLDLPSAITHETFFDPELRRTQNAIHKFLPSFFPMIPEVLYSGNPMRLEINYPDDSHGSGYGSWVERLYFPLPEANYFVRRLDICIVNKLDRGDAMFQFLRLLAHGEIGFERVQHLAIYIRSGLQAPPQHQLWSVARTLVYIKDLIKESGGLEFRTEGLTLSANNHMCDALCVDSRNRTCALYRAMTRYFRIRADGDTLVKVGNMPLWRVRDFGIGPCDIHGFRGVVSTSA